MISSLKLDNNNLLNKLDIYKEKLNESQNEIANKKQNIEILTFEKSQNLINLNKKDIIINELKKKIEEMENEINMKENDFKILLENKQIEVIEYN